MRILHCITGLTPDGAQRMLLRLACDLQSRGFLNTIVSLGGEEPLANTFRARGIPVVSLGMSRGLSGALPAVRALRVIRAAHPDILQGWMYHANLMLSLYRGMVREDRPVVWNIRRSLDDVRERALLTRGVIRVSARLSPRADRVIFCTEGSRRQHETAGFSTTNGVVLGNGFDTDTFTPSLEARRHRRKEWGIPDDVVVIGNVGREDVAKGRDVLLEAFAKLVSQGAPVVLVIVGRGIDDPRCQLVVEAQRLGISERVLLQGPQEKPQEIYPAFDIYCSSSISEGFPNVIAEAMSSELPVVATDVGCSCELVNGIGEVVPPRSSEELATALHRMIVEGAAGWRARGARGRQRITEHYALGAVTTRYGDLYEDLVRARGSRGAKKWPVESRGI